MSSSEFAIVAGIIMVGILFFMAAQTFIASSGKEALESKYKSEAENLVQIINKISKFEGNTIYEKKISFSNITVENGVLTYQKDKYEFRFLIPKNVENSQILDTTKLCIKKVEDKIYLDKECGKCNHDLICQPEECSVSCSDCAGPSDVCKGDGVCNKEIGENCENSPQDCACEGKVCCPSSPDSDENGCSPISGKEKGEKCYCDSQCKNGLVCDPTSPDFTDYEKACCEPGKSWNGSECKEMNVYVVALVPIYYSQDELQNSWKERAVTPSISTSPNELQNSWKERAESIKNFIFSTTPFRENPNSLVVLIGEENCQLNSEDDSVSLINCGNRLAQKYGYGQANIVGGISRNCVGGDGCGGIAGYTIPGQGWFIHGYDLCTLYGCPSVQDAVVAPHEIGHNFRLCEGYCYKGESCYEEEREKFGYHCGTSRVEQKFPGTRSATPQAPCGNCGPDVCCEGRLLTGDPINNINNGRDIMGGGSGNPNRAFACDSYLAFKDVAAKLGFDVKPPTDQEIRKCYDHIRGDTYP